MADNVTTNQSTTDELKKLARLYVQNQNLSGKSPAEIYTLYEEAYYEIRKDRLQKRNSGWFRQKDAELKQP